MKPDVEKSEDNVMSECIEEDMMNRANVGMSNIGERNVMGSNYDAKCEGSGTVCMDSEKNDLTNKSEEK